jgi:hypothetical protein
MPDLVTNDVTITGDAGQIETLHKAVANPEEDNLVHRI